MKKQKKVGCFLLILVLLFSSCSNNTLIENRSNYDETVELLMHYTQGDEDYRMYRCVYDSKINKIVPISRDIKVGSSGSFYPNNSEYLEKINDYAKQNELGQFNDYFRIDNMEVFIYWAANNINNSVIIVKDDQIKEYVIKTPLGDAIGYCYHTENSISFSYKTTWNIAKHSPEKNSLYLQVFTIDFGSDSIIHESIPLYNSQIEKSFSVNEKLTFSIEERVNGYDFTKPKIVNKGEYYIICSPFETMNDSVDGNFEGVSYWINQVNKTTFETEKMLIVDGEKMLDFWETENGYALISISSSFIEEGKYMEGYIEGVNEAFITFYDKDLKVLNKDIIPLEYSFEYNFIEAAHYENTVYFIEGCYNIEQPIPYGTVVHKYDIENKTVIKSKNYIKCVYDDFHIIKKENDKIYHLGGL